MGHPGSVARIEVQSQPWALRTAIMVRRMSFQVLGASITELGNMQPSQQMWWKALVGLPSVVAHPESGDGDDVELAVGVAGQAVAAGLVVRAGAVDGAVVLGDVEVDGPGAQGVGRSCVARRRARPGPTSRSLRGAGGLSGAL